MAIKVQPFVIDAAVLDLIGRGFAFDHAKGLAEWVKNSADAYLREGAPDEDQFIIVRFTSSPSGNALTRIECIDFVGMRKKQIDDAFKRFFDPEASRKGARDATIKTLGGHGNGGKFYMRQMFKTSHAFTWRAGRINVFGFNSLRQYGFESAYEDRTMSLKDALAKSGLANLDLPESVRLRLAEKDAGFTVIVGEGPVKGRGSNNAAGLVEKLIYHPQARRLIERKQVYVVFNDEKTLTRLTAPRIQPKQGFETPTIVPVPAEILHNGETVAFKSERYPWPGKLTLRTSDQPLRSNLAALNTIDFIGEVGVVASYRIHEIGASRFSAHAEFIFGECECPILEDPQLDCVENERVKLVQNIRSAALLDWVRQQIEALAETMETRVKQDQQAQDLKNTASLNQMLNRWKDRFLNQVWADMFGGNGTNGSLGGETGFGGGKGDGINSGGKQRGANGSQGGSETVRKSRFPQVLVSGVDRDPLDSSGSIFTCDPRHPAVYQRTKDVAASIYWINTARPLALKIRSEYGGESPRWREYLFQRYVDIIAKEAIYHLGKASPALSPDAVISKIDEITTLVHDQAARDLNAFLFEEQITQ